MKYKIWSVLAVLAAFLAAVGASSLSTEHPTGRVHQHLESRGPDAGCTCDGSTLCTHLPLVMLDTGGAAIPGEPILAEDGSTLGFTTAEDGESMISARVSVMDSAERNNHPDDAPALESSMQIRVRGNSSRFFEKKSYLLRLTDTDGTYRNEKMMGMDTHYEWALYGPYLDKSLIRNYMFYNLAGELMDYAPNVRFCEVILNGEYQGLYVMAETITSGKNSRLNLSPPLSGTDRTGFVVRVDRGSEAPLKNIETFTQYTYRSLRQMDIQYPRSGDLTPELAASIAQEVSDFEKTLYSYDYDTDDYGYWHDIDVDAFVDYFILNEFTVNYDAGYFSTYLYKDIGGKYTPVVWDFNSACDNYQEAQMVMDELQMVDSPCYFMLTKDEYFTGKVLRRYEELRRGILSDESLDRYIDETLAYLGPAIDRNFAVWSDSMTEHLLMPEYRDIHSHAEAVEQLRDFLHARGAWLDEHLETIQQYSHESKVKKFNH